MKRSVVIFGAGVFAKRIALYIEKYFRIKAVCDNSPVLWGKKFNDIYPIISVENISKMCSDCEVLIALNDRKNYDIISNQLNQLGIKCRHVNDALYNECVRNNELFFTEEESKGEIDKFTSAKRNIFVLTAPSHSNLGDHAQTYCIQELLRDKYGDSNIFIYDENQIAKNYYELLYIIKQNLKQNDLVLLHSGYRLTDLFMVSVYIVEMMGQLFSERRMVFLPQTIHFLDEIVKDRISKSINDKVVIMCRDVLSYENAKQIFPRSKAVLYPDMVTSLIGRLHFKHCKKGILVCLRKAGDGESLLSKDEAEQLIFGLKHIDDVSITDTTIDVDWREIAANRKNYVENEIEWYSKFQLIITNRYHGTIFALAANTPVIVLPTRDHKITAGLRWFEEAGYKGIYFCEKVEDVYEATRKIVTQNEPVSNSDYFYKKFFKDFNLEEI